MCGIVGYVGPQPATTIVFNGLKRLEYRGYDSAGIAAVQGDGEIAVRRDEGKLINLQTLLQQSPINGHIAIGHTRWATHGEPSQRNAHPHTDESNTIALIQNGIVENYRSLKKELEENDHHFQSDTDTEVIVHLIDENLRAGFDFISACRLAFNRLKGSHAIVVLNKHKPDKMIAARLGNAGGVTIGVGDGEMFLASDMPAILEHTRRMIFLEDGEMAVIAAEGATFTTLDGAKVKKSITEIAWDPVSAEKGEYRHFMQKEIAEQARSLTDTIGERIDFETGEAHLAELNLSVEAAKNIKRIASVACGTSAYACLVGKFMIEELARIPVEVDYASEFRYRNPVIDHNTLFLAISQSGETADTLAAMDEAKKRGARLVSIVNVVGSMAQRISDGIILMRTGPEIGVASTKAFTASLVDQLLLAMALGQARGTLSPEKSYELAQAIMALPDQAGHVLSNGNDFETIANIFHEREHFLYLGRGINYPIALEGALKLKEISYIHAEGYPAGEMKHGPIALIDEDMPVVAIALQDRVYEKMISQIEQVKARNGIVIALANEGDRRIANLADHVLTIPKTHPLLSPVLAVLPLQQLAYHLAVRRGADVDQPRNLAKSVTVE
ncbi:MAG: glutamine--fructose-6-phosphate transaminase (isomerizing) [Anaerolineaceae bacterium 4572_5.2]|nr:MAG: glutamine--fructose-6-phosphate transaminase (isomerizing) [Anaerolineaceae bacterium 4572_5.2]